VAAKFYQVHLCISVASVAKVLQPLVRKMTKSIYSLSNFAEELLLENLSRLFFASLREINFGL
jgi:hypothetical protein